MDGEEVYRASLTQQKTSVYEALDQVLTLYKSQPVAWSTGTSTETVETAAKENKLVTLVFADEKENSAKTLQALEDRAVAKFHSKILFVRVDCSKESEEAKRWGVTQVPALVAINPAKGNALEKLVGKKNFRDVRSFFAKNLKKLEKENK